MPPPDPRAAQGRAPHQQSISDDLAVLRASDEANADAVIAEVLALHRGPPPAG